MQWVKHDTDANQDNRLQNVLLDYGLEGYGLYWYCIELIAGKVSLNNITFELEHDARIIARNVGSTPQKVEEMMRRFVELGLFEDTNGRVTCLKLAKRLDKSMTSNPKMRALIEKVKNSHDGVMTIPDSVMQDKNRIDKNRITNGTSDDEPMVVIQDDQQPAPAKTAKPQYPDEFEWIWQHKPERAGGNGKKSAYNAFRARIKAGATWRELAEGLKRYAAHCKAEGKLGTPYVMQMATFFGPDEHFRNEWLPASKPQQPTAAPSNLKIISAADKAELTAEEKQAIAKTREDLKKLTENM